MYLILALQKLNSGIDLEFQNQIGVTEVDYK